MVSGLMKRAAQTRQILGTEVNTAAQENARLIGRQVQVEQDAGAGSRKLQHLRARRGTNQRK